MINNRLNFIVFGCTIILFSMIACKKYDNEIGVPENYILTEQRVSNDCVFFQMRFTKGEYLLKYSLSGTCKDLKDEEYLKNFSMYIDSNYESLKNKRGYIIIDHNKISNIEFFQHQIIQITKRLGSPVSLFENSENSFTLLLSDN